jgi:tetratricopeptide (TPR) repeat protein
MGVWLIWFALCVPADEPGEPQERSPSVREAIDRAIRRLGADQFAVRRQASRFLWRQGLAAEPGLLRAAEDPDREIRLRAGLILEDFHYGILPDVPEEVNDLIRQFRSSDAQQRLAALQLLADRDDFARVQHLIQLEPDGGVRRTLLVYLMRNPRAIEYFLRLERLEEWVVAIGADQDVAWRQTTLAQMLFSEPMIRRLSARGELRMLVNVVRREESAEVRRAMLSRLFENAAAVASLVQHNQLDLLLELIQLEPQLRQRSQWILQIVAAPQTIKILVEGDHFQGFLEFARKNAEPEQQAALVQRVVQHPDVVQAIMANSGVDGLIELASVEEAAGQRGALLAEIAGSTGVRQAMNTDGQRELILQLAAKREPIAMHNQYMKGILNSGHGHSLFQHPESRQVLWELIEPDLPDTDLAEKDWRGEAIFRLLTMSGAQEIFRQEKELQWLMRFLDDQVTDDQRQRLLQRVLVDYRLQRLLNEIEYFDPLLAAIKKTPDDQRGVLLARLVAMTTVQRLADTDQIDRVLTLARDESVDPVRVAYLENLFRNQAAMASLIAAERYEALWELLLDQQSSDRYAALRGDFYSTSPVLNRLQQQEQIDTLIEFAQQQTVPSAKHGYLVKLFRNSQVMSLLIDRGHFETLDEMAHGAADEDQEIVLLSAFYVSSHVLKRMADDQRIDQVVEFAERHLTGNSLRVFLQQICQQEAAIDAIVQQEQLDRALELIKQQTQDHQQAYLLRLFLAAPRVVAHYGSEGRLHDLFSLIGQISHNSRYQVWDSLLQRSENVQVVLENEMLDDLLQHIDQEPQAPHRGILLGRLLTHPPMIEYWVARRGVDSLFDLIDVHSEEHARRNLLRTLFHSEPAIQALLAAGGFERLYQMAWSDANLQQRDQLLAQLLTNPKMVEYLVAEDRIDRLIQVAGQQGDVEIRRRVLGQIVASPVAVEALLDGGYLDPLVKLCRLDHDSTARRQLLVTLLESRGAAEHLADTEELAPIIREILGETDEDSRRGFIQSVLSRREILPLLVDRGLFALLLDAVDQDEDADQRRLVLLPLLNHPQAVRELSRLGRIPAMIQWIDDQAVASDAGQIPSGIFSSPAAVQAIIANGGFESLLKWIGHEESRGQVAPLLASLWTNPAAVTCLVEQGLVDRFRHWLEERQDPSERRQLLQLWLHREEAQSSLAHRQVAEWLVQWVKEETEEGFRRSHAIRLAGNSRIRQHLLTHGQGDFLREVLDWIPASSDSRQPAEALVLAPSGWVAHLHRQGQPSLADKVLQQQLPEDDSLRLHLANYWWVHDRLEQQIHTFQHRWQTDRKADDGRQLVYLHRVAGDLSSAYRIAEALQDPGLQNSLLIEMRRWADAAALQRSHPCPLPIPCSRLLSATAQLRQIERWAQTAACERLAGDQEAASRTIAQIIEAAAASPEDPMLQRRCALVLLANHRIRQGLEFLAEHAPEQAASVLAEQLRFREALRLLGWPDATPHDEAWIGSLPTQGYQEGMHPLGQVASALEIAQLLHRLGHVEAAIATAELVEDYSRKLPEEPRVSSLRRQCLERVSGTWLTIGQPQRAWQAAAETSPSPALLSMLPNRLHSQRGDDPRNLWTLLQRTRPNRPAETILAQLDSLLNPSPAEDLAEFNSLIQSVLPLIDSNDSAANDATRAAIARVCIQRDQRQLARRVLEEADPNRLAILALSAEIAWRDQQWSEAAELFERLWDADHDRLTDLYLAGSAMQKAGLPEEADQRWRLAHQLAITGPDRLRLARGLLSYGRLDHELTDRAIEQCHLVLRTAAPGHRAWYEATQLLAKHAQDAPPDQTADWIDDSALGDFAMPPAPHPVIENLRMVSRVHLLRALAAIEAGQFDKAFRHAGQALDATPADTTIGEELVPRFDDAGHERLADQLFQRQYEVYRQAIAEWPDSAMLNHNLARLVAQCKRPPQD